MSATCRCCPPLGRSLPEQVRAEVCGSATETSETVLQPRTRGSAAWPSPAPPEPQRRDLALGCGERVSFLNRSFPVTLPSGWGRPPAELRACGKPLGTLRRFAHFLQELGASQVAARAAGGKEGGARVSPGGPPE